MSYSQFKIIIPHRMHSVEVRVWDSEGGLNRAYRRSPGDGEGGPVVGFCQHLADGSVRIHLGPYWTLSDLVHECVHAAQYIALVAEKQDDEFVAYLSGWLTERAATRLQGGK